MAFLLMRGYRLVLAVVALATLTWVTGSIALRTDPAPGTSAVAPLLEHAPAWQISDGATLQVGPEHALSLRAGASHGTARYAPADMPAPGSQLRFSGRLVRLGPRTAIPAIADRPRVFLRFVDAAGLHLSYGAAVRTLGQRRRLPFDTLSTVPPLAQGFELVLWVPPSSAWRLEAPRLQRVVPAQGYAAWRALLVAGWVGLMVAALVGIAGRVSPARLIPTVLVLMGVVVLVVLSRRGMDGLISPVLRLSTALLPDTVSLGPQAVSKLGHAIAFGLLTLCCLTLRRALNLSAGGIAVLCTALAFATEALQRHRPGRSAELFDVGIDLVGIISVLAVLALWKAARGVVARRAAS